MSYRMEDAADLRVTLAKTEADAANSEYAAALEMGDWKKAADAQRKLARAEARGVAAEQDRALWEAQRQELRRQPIGDPVEAYINQVRQQTPKSANWLRQHRDWITDPKKNAKLTAAHWDAVGEGIAVDSPEYFARVEKTIGLSEPSKPGSPGASEVRLTPSEVAAATDGSVCWGREGGAKCGQPVGVAEYARRKSAMRAAAGNPWYGKLD